MASKSIILLLGIVILAVIVPENEAAGPPEPMNRMIKGWGITDKCFVYMWEGLCTPANCTVDIKAKLTMKGGGTMMVPMAPIPKPFTTKDKKQGVCFHDKNKDKSCCDMIFNGTAATAVSVNFGDYEQIAINITRTQYNVNKTWTDKMRVLPWMVCTVPTNPCMNNGSCTVQASTGYKCACSDGWQGMKCGDKMTTTMIPTTGATGLVSSFVIILTLVVLVFLHM